MLLCMAPVSSTSRPEILLVLSALQTDQQLGSSQRAPLPTGQVSRILSSYTVESGYNEGDGG